MSKHSHIFETSLSSKSPGVSIILSFPVDWLICCKAWFSILSWLISPWWLSIFSKGIIYSVNLVVQVSALFCSLSNNELDNLIKVFFPEREPPKIKISKEVVACNRLIFPKFW